MKIVAVNSYHLHSNIEQPFGFSQWYYDQRNVLLIEVITDSGLSGWGECYGPADVTQGAIEHFYAPKLIGMDPLHIEQIWQHMWRSSLDFARAGVMMAAMSGLDIALWDLKGKLTNQSVSTLIGACYHEYIPCYATGMYYLDGYTEQELLPKLINEAKGYAKEGFKAMKIKVGKNLAFDKAFIKAMRQALPDTILMADANHGYSYPEALEIGRELDKHQFAWFEEPVSPEAYEHFSLLHQKLDTPIATGECQQTRYGFKQLLDTHAIDFIQPDIAYCGGISEALKIRALASSSSVNLIPHVWGTMVNLAAATHLLASQYNEPGRFEPTQLFLEYDRTENPLRDQIFSQAVNIHNGQAKVPTGPGLGIEVDKHAMQPYLVRMTETHG